MKWLAILLGFLWLSPLASAAEPPAYRSDHHCRGSNIRQGPITLGQAVSKQDAGWQNSGCAQTANGKTRVEIADFSQARSRWMGGLLEARGEVD